MTYKVVLGGRFSRDRPTKKIVLSLRSAPSHVELSAKVAKKVKQSAGSSVELRLEILMVLKEDEVEDFDFMG